MLRALIFIALTIPGFSFAQDAGLARGWYLTGNGVEAYEVTTTDEGTCGGRAARITSRNAAARGPIGLIQSFRAENYRGQRVRYSATVNTTDVQGWAGLFFRVDDASRKTLTFDDMRNRPFRGTRKCAHVSVVVAIPDNAEMITLGVNQQGVGTTELSEINVTKVDGLEPLTGTEAATSGRIGDVWFTDVLVGANLRKLQNYRLKRVAPGQWKDESGYVSATLDGEVIHASMYDGASTLSGDLKAERDDTTLKITGQWGTAIANYPLSIVVSDERVDMTWGNFERHLTALDQTQTPAGCRYYGSTSDHLELCGAVLGKTPPSTQVVMAFVMNGFRRFDAFRDRRYSTPLGQNPSRIQPGGQ